LAGSSTGNLSSVNTRDHDQQYEVCMYVCMYVCMFAPALEFFLEAEEF
jgi:hypothetical protein